MKYITISIPCTVQEDVLALLRGACVSCLGKTKAGHPRHPALVPFGIE